MEVEHIADEHTQKKGRHRKKQLYHSILQQMEFYFSDANLTKDRMLSQQIENDPYVDVALFMKFNRIRKLTPNIEDVTKAISKSELIELSEDKAKVRRKGPIKIKENVEECTIYVERLKSDATHDWLTAIFSEFGTVVYVSIPKYRHSGMIKGFAFVEFDTEESAKAAVQYFESIDCKIPSHMEPQKLQSIVTFEGDKNNKSDEMSEANAERRTENRKKRKHSDDNDSHVEKKKKVTDDVSDINNAVAEKQKSESDGEPKRKRKVSEEQILDDTNAGDAHDVKKKKVELDIDVKTSNKVQDTMSESEGEEKKKKKQKKSHRKKVNLKEIGLLILSKKEWKKMRNRYLEMQRKTMKELKKHLNRQRFVNSYEPYKRLETYEQSSEMDTNQETDKKASLAFTAGIIVKMQLAEPCYENKKLKNEIKACSSDIQYVDIPLSAGSEEVYVRFADPKHAASFCTSNAKGKCCVLDGNEETEYWKKIEAFRSAKQKKTGTKQRGRDKLLKKAEKQVSKHVHFDDSE